MNWSTMIDQIKNVNVESLAILIIVGVIWCFLGLKTVRFWAALGGFGLGLALGIGAGDVLGLTDAACLGVGAVLGIILLILCIRFYKFGVFLAVWMGGTGCGILILQPQNIALLGACGAVGLVLALLAIKFTAAITMIVTAVYGAVLAGSQIAGLLFIQNGWIEAGICVVIGVLGFLVQYLFESKKKKKENLKKAAEIRDTHSTANEVEKARAVMENLDSLTGIDEEEEPEQKLEDEE